MAVIKTQDQKCPDCGCETIDWSGFIETDGDWYTRGHCSQCGRDVCEVHEFSFYEWQD